MNLTNRLNLPEALVRFARRTSYSPGDSYRTVSGVLSPPRMAVLQARYGGELTEDVAERCYALLGTAVHEVARNAHLARAMEHLHQMIRLAGKGEKDTAGWWDSQRRLLNAVDEAAKDAALAEVRWRMLVPLDDELGEAAKRARDANPGIKGVTAAGIEFSGATDEVDVDGGVLYDWKTTTTDAMAYGKLQDWERRANLYVALLEANGVTIRKVVYVPVYRDWQRRRAGLEPDYPQSMFGSVELPLWPREQSLAFLRERLLSHLRAEVELPRCSDEERWRGGGWRVEDRDTGRAKPGGARFETREQMLAWLLEERPTNFRTLRTGKSRRCAEGWCPVSGRCDQWGRDPENPRNYPVGPSGLPIIKGG